MSPTPTRPSFELLAPAGDWSAFEAALDAGADAVYLGLTALNARHRARNFSPDELVRAVALAHARGRRVYLTLNVDVAERELGTAARALRVAAAAGVDAVLVRDPGLLALKPHFPSIEFHFSTQAGSTSSVDVEAAKELGITRAVLARELSLDEMRAASAVGLETEVFGQGALCFSVSGRCLLSSWVGGRSGNRGSCTSPCRVPWTADGAPLGTPMSMRDLCVVDRIDDLRATGTCSLKIEGRLKTAAWVRRAVELYRRAIDGAGTAEALLADASALGGYTGRQLTSGYLDGKRDEVTGVSGGRGRMLPPSPAPASAADSKADPAEEGAEEATPAAAPLKGYALRVDVEPQAVRCTCTFGAASDVWTLPKSEVRRAHKAVAIEALFARLAETPVDATGAGRLESNEPAYLLVPRAANAIADRVAAFVRRTRRDRAEIRSELPAALKAVLAAPARHESNRHALGSRPDRARISSADLVRFLEAVQPSAGVIVEGLSAEALPRALSARGRTTLVVALPQVFFEESVPAVRALLRACREANLRVEVNSWGGWWLAKQEGLRMEAGPGLPVLNALAASTLAALGMESVTLSVEADREQLEEVSARCPAPCSLYVFGRPALMTSRVELDGGAIEGKVLEDRRGVRLQARREGGLWALRPRDPFDLRRVDNERIRVRHLVVDLVGSPDPVGEWGSPGGVLRFNYDRRLA